MKISDLKPHPRQLEIYGVETVDAELVKSIKANGILEPLIVTEDGIILSGFRRFCAAKKAGLKECPTQLRAELSDVEQLNLLIESNRQRVKTNRQKAREAIILQEIERERARIRQVATQNNDSGRAVSANLREQGSGRTSEYIGKHLGMGARTVEKLIEVEKEIKALEGSGKKDEAKKLEKKLTKSVNAAHSQVKPKPKKEAKPRDLILPKVVESTADADETAHVTEEWVKKKQWELYLPVMQKLTGKSEDEARKMLGRLIQDTSQSAVMGAMAIAGNNMNFIKSEKLEPFAYVKAIANKIKFSGNGKEKPDKNKQLIERMIAEREHATE